MKTTVQYLNEAKEALGFDSDRKLAIWMEVSTAALARYQNGERTLDNYAAAKIAEALKLDPMEVIGAANWEREKDGKRREYWRQVVTRSAAAVLATAIISPVFQGVTATAKTTYRGLCARARRTKAARTKHGGKLHKIIRRNRRHVQENHGIRLLPA